MLTIFGAVDELDQEYILQRQRDGIAIAITNGVYKERKPIECPEFKQIVTFWLNGKLSTVEG